MFFKISCYLHVYAISSIKKKVCVNKVDRVTELPCFKFKNYVMPIIYAYYLLFIIYSLLDHVDRFDQNYVKYI